jgi:hypothetical protein
MTTEISHRNAAPERGDPSSRQGIGRDSVATFDNAAAVPRSVLSKRPGKPGADGPRRICMALDAFADC